MDHLPKEKNTGKPRILIAPLDWGLGHATRCIPVIRELLAQNCEVILAAEGRQAELLTAEFPQLLLIPLTGYKIKYAKSGPGLLWNIIFQIPKILISIKKENAWLMEVVNKYNIDIIISDNRYGLYHHSVLSIFITHQLKIKSPLGIWSEKIIQKLNYKYINRFTECWVPDREDVNNLSGELGHPVKKPGIPVHYIGLLSRFDKSTILNSSLTGVKEKHLLIILSGPEPQRSIIENNIISEISNYNGTAIIVRGLPGYKSLLPSTNMIKFYNHLPTEELYNELEKAEYVISRSGYSTLMDVIVMKKKSILIPTPGQTEQEYLADYCMKKKLALCYKQKAFSLELALKKAKQFDYRYIVLNHQEKLKNIILQLLRKT